MFQRINSSHSTLCILCTVGVLFLSGSACADGLLRVQQTIFGMDCAPCAYGIRQGLLKLPGVQHVTVSLNDGKATVELAPNNAVTLAEIQSVIRHHGFTPEDATITISGHFEKRGDQYYMSVQGAADYLLQAGQPEILSGVSIGSEVVAECKASEADVKSRALHVSHIQMVTGIPSKK